MIEKNFKTLILVISLVFVSLFGLISFNYSKSTIGQIYVSGSASKDFSNQTAEFSITFTSKNKEKNKAEEENITKVNKFLEDVKNFGIGSDNTITESINSYQEQESYQENGVFKSKPGDWVFSQIIRIKIKDVAKVNDFVALVGKNPTSNVFGPNFSIDNKNLDETEVYELAFDDAKKKAQTLADRSGRKLGKVISINEGPANTNPLPIAFATRALGGGGSDMSPQVPSGTSSVSKTLQVIFELK